MAAGAKHVRRVRDRDIAALKRTLVSQLVHEQQVSAPSVRSPASIMS